MFNQISTIEAPPIGSHDDIYNRLIEQLPPWFGSSHPVLDTILESFITVSLFNYQQLQYISLQMRLQTATDNNLDLISKDYLGNTLPRRTGETDDSYRNRISATILQEKDTRNGMSNALFFLTGFYPLIFEPWNSTDTGCCNVNAYCNISYCGSGSYAYQCFIDVYVGAYTGMAGYGGCNNTPMACNIINGAAANWCGGDYLKSTEITDQDIYTLIELTKVYGTVCWTRIIRGNE